MTSIKSEIIEIPKRSFTFVQDDERKLRHSEGDSPKNLFDNSFIESTLKSLGIDPIRWAVVGVSDDTLRISVSY